MQTTPSLDNIKNKTFAQFICAEFDRHNKYKEEIVITSFGRKWTPVYWCEEYIYSVHKENGNKSHVINLKNTIHIDYEIVFE